MCLRPATRPARFLSTLSLRRATHALSVTGSESQFLSTLSLRRATALTMTCWPPMIISIHALLAESDRHGVRIAEIDLAFLSTLSLRRATTSQVPTWFGMPNFYPRSPCGERQKVPQILGLASGISIHALLAESDLFDDLQVPDSVTFLSTLSLRRATHPDHGNPRRLVISIHALLAESDAVCNQLLFDTLISIHALLAESDYIPLAVPHFCKGFLSTLSLRRATHISRGVDHHNKNFYPRSPCGERRVFCRALQNKFSISIHALLAESD